LNPGLEQDFYFVGVSR